MILRNNYFRQFVFLAMLLVWQEDEEGHHKRNEKYFVFKTSVSLIFNSNFIDHSLKTSLRKPSNLKAILY